VTVVNGGTLQYEDVTAWTLTVGANVTVDTGATFQSAATGTQTGHAFSIGANLVNAGMIDFSANTDTAGAGRRLRRPETATQERPPRQALLLFRPKPLELARPRM
jgi:hypothetical protein